MPKTTPREEIASVGSQKAKVHLEKHAHANMSRTRKAKGREDLFTFSDGFSATTFEK